MGTVAIQTQCCLSQTDDEWDDEDGTQEEGTAVQLVEPVPWHSDRGPAGAPPRPPAAVPRSLSEATTVIPRG